MKECIPSKRGELIEVNLHLPICKSEKDDNYFISNSKSFFKRIAESYIQKRNSTGDITNRDTSWQNERERLKLKAKNTSSTIRGYPLSQQ